MTTYALYSISQETILKSGLPYPNADPDHRTAWADTAASLNLPADFSEVVRG